MAPVKVLFLGSTLLCFLLCRQHLVAQNLDADEIVRRSVEVSIADWKQTADFDYFERETADGKNKTNEVILLQGSRYYRLIAIDDKSLSPDATRYEDERLDKARAERQRETPQQRKQRLSQYEKERSQQTLLLEQLEKAFQFTLAGRDVVGAHDVYVLKARPRPGYHPPNNRAKALTAMEGTLWVDAADFHWVRLEAEVKRSVSIEAFFARVDPGTRFELEQRPVGEKTWLPTRFSMRTRARILFFFPHNEQKEETYYGYHQRR